MDDNTTQDHSFEANNPQPTVAQPAPQPQYSQPSPVMSQPQTKRRTLLWVILGVIVAIALASLAYYTGMSQGKAPIDATDKSALSSEQVDPAAADDNKQEDISTADTDPVAPAAPTAPSDWNTLKNSYHDIEISYPKTVHLSDTTSYEGRYLGLMTLSDVGGEPNRLPVAIQIFREARFGLCGTGESPNPKKPDVAVKIGTTEVTATPMCNGVGQYYVSVVNGRNEKAIIILDFLDRPSAHDQTYRDILASIRGFTPSQ